MQTYVAHGQYERNRWIDVVMNRLFDHRLRKRKRSPGAAEAYKILQRQRLSLR